MIESEEDFEQEVIETAEHYLYSTNVSWVAQLLEVCITVDTPTAQTPLQQATDRSCPNVSHQQTNHSEDSPVDQDHASPRFRLQESSRTQDITHLQKLSI